MSEEKFLLQKSMELIEELRENVTCSLPCIYCAKYDYDIKGVCDGRFKWIYEDRIKELLNRKDKE